LADLCCDAVAILFPEVWNVVPGGLHTFAVWKNDLYRFSQVLFKEKK